jgi:probable rRNA maturation factor
VPSPDDSSRSIYRGPWRIDITTRAGTPSLVPYSRLAESMSLALEAAGAPRPASIGLILADDAELAGLNAGHLGKTGPTDVLSFPLLPPAVFPDHPGRAASAASAGPAIEFALPPGRRRHLGDIVVSVERAVDQAEAGRGGQTGDVRWSATDELLLLVTHGTLHVCGWDHAEPLEESAMRALEQRLLSGAAGPG